MNQSKYNKNIVKVMLTLVLLFAIILSLSSQKVYADDEWWWNDVSSYLTYSDVEHNGEWHRYVTGLDYGPESSLSINIPATIPSVSKYDSALRGKSVYGVSTLANESLRNIGKVTIAEGVQALNSGAFMNCTVLEKVVLPSTLTLIEDHVFANCFSLRSVNIPEGITYIPEGLFENCSSLESIHLPSTVKSIGADAFKGCSRLCDINLENVTDIGAEAFMNCEALKNADISLCTSLGTGAFNNCRNLEKVILHSGTQSISDYAFYECRSLKEINLPSSLQSIGDSAFYNCSSLETLELINVNSIGQHAFANCTGLKTLKLSASLRSCNSNSFKNLVSLENLDIGMCIGYFGRESFQIFPALKTLNVISPIGELGSILKNHPTLEYVSVVRIDGIRENDLSNCRNLKVFKVDEIHGSSFCFAGCTSLEELVISSSAIEFEWFDDTIQGCDNLKKLTVPKNTHLDNGFYYQDLPSLEEYTGPIDVRSHFNCENLKKATVYCKKESDLYLYPLGGCKNLEELIIKDGPDTLDASVLCGSTPKYLTVEGSKKVLADGFTGATSLKQVSLPDVIDILPYGFKNCSSLEMVVLPDIAYIGADSFENCKMLKTVVIGEQFPDISKIAFEGANPDIFYPLSKEEFEKNGGDGFSRNQMPPIYFYSENPPTQWDNFYHIVDGNYVKWDLYPIKWFDSNGKLLKTTGSIKGVMPEEIEAPIVSGYVFERWTPDFKKVESAQEYRAVMFPDLSYEISGGECTVKGIGNYTDKELAIPDTYKGCKVTKIAPKAFKGNANLTNITLGQNIKNIDKQAFEGCSFLKSVFIGKNVSSIDEFAFKDCYALETLAVDADNAYYCTEGNVLYDKAKTTLILAADKGVKGRFIIPDTVTSVGEQAIRHCTEITEVIIPDSIKEFKPGSFMDCTSLKKVVFPDTVTKLGSAAFMNCESLEYVDFGKGLKALPAACCSKCPNLTTAVIGDKISTLYLVPFLGCPSLKDIYFTGDEGAWNKLFRTISPLDTVLKTVNVHFGHPDDMQFDDVNAGGSSGSNDDGSADYTDTMEDSQRSSFTLIFVICCVAVAIIAGVVIYKKKQGNKTKD